MSERSRKRDRREARRAASAPAHVPVSRLAKHNPVPANRGTFAVARANAQLAEALPDLIYRKPENRKSAPPRVPDTPPLASAVPSNSGPARKSKPAPEARREGMSLDKLPTGCKPRPKSSKGDGSGRDFVPWCGKR